MLQNSYFHLLKLTCNCPRGATFAPVIVVLSCFKIAHTPTRFRSFLYIYIIRLQEFIDINAKELM